MITPLSDSRLSLSFCDNSCGFNRSERGGYFGIGSRGVGFSGCMISIYKTSAGFNKPSCIPSGIPSVVGRDLSHQLQ